MSASSRAWRNTTHDWARTVDTEHLAHVRRAADVVAAGGTTHLILEVLAYAADEAEWTGTLGRCRVTLRADGSVSVADNGRGTDTRRDAQDQAVKKPVMATKDLRFFDSPGAQQLPDGRPRRGLSVVAALSPWLVHTNRRRNGAWTQRYEHGVPVTGLLPVPDQDTTGTTVHFLPADSVRSMQEVSPSVLRRLAARWPQLAVEVIDERVAPSLPVGSNPDRRVDVADGEQRTPTDAGPGRAAVCGESGTPTTAESHAAPTAFSTSSVAWRPSRAGNAVGRSGSGYFNGADPTSKEPR